MFLLCKDFCIRCCSRCQQQKGAVKLQATEQPGKRDGCHGHTAQPGDIPANVALPSCSTAAPSSAGTHKPRPCADPAGMKTAWPLLLRAATSQLLSHEEDSSRETLDGPEQCLELDVMGMTLSTRCQNAARVPQIIACEVRWPKPTD